MYRLLRSDLKLMNRRINYITTIVIQFKKTALWETHLRVTGHHLPCEITPCHPTQVNVPRLNPSRTGQYPIYLPRMDGRLS